jgi:hypothetical protein
MRTSPAPAVLARLRFRSHSGRFIRQHRALRRARITRATLLTALTLPLAFTALLLAALPAITGYWSGVLRFALPRLGIEAALVPHPMAIGNWLLGALGVPALAGHEPDPVTIAIFAAAIIAVLAVAYLGRRRYLPLAYLVWAMALLLALTLFVQARPGAFAHTIAGHLLGELQLAVEFLLAVPWLLSLSYYVFDVGILRKIGCTVMTLGYIAAYVPVQYAAHAALLHHGSLAFAPVLFVFGGMLVHVLVFIALYGWFMSWERIE